MRNATQKGAPPATVRGSPQTSCHLLRHRQPGGALTRTLDCSPRPGASPRLKTVGATPATPRRGRRGTADAAARLSGSSGRQRDRSHPAAAAYRDAHLGPAAVKQSPAPWGARLDRQPRRASSLLAIAAAAITATALARAMLKGERRGASSKGTGPQHAGAPWRGTATRAITPPREPCRRAGGRDSLLRQRRRRGMRGRRAFRTPAGSRRRRASRTARSMMATATRAQTAGMPITWPRPGSRGPSAAAAASPLGRCGRRRKADRVQGPAGVQMAAAANTRSTAARSVAAGQLPATRQSAPSATGSNGAAHLPDRLSHRTAGAGCQPHPLSEEWERIVGRHSGRRNYKRG